VLGRFFLPEDGAPSSPQPVAVLSYEFWRKQFGGDPDVVGRSIRMNRTHFIVIGVAPEGFRGIHAGTPELIWVPLTIAVSGKPPGKFFDRNDGWLEIIGRLRPGASFEQASAEMATLAQRFEAAYPDDRDSGLQLSPLKGVYASVREGAAKQTSLLMAVVLCVLLIACANLAGLLLTRGTTRRKEIAVRLVLGASRVRLVRQLMIENLLLSLLGGVAGLILGTWVKDLIAASFTYGLSDLDLRLDPLVLTFTLALSILTGFVFGLTPALQATRLDLATALKDSETRGSSRQSRLQAGLVVAQIALSLVLLAGAGLIIQSLRSVLAHPGYDPGHIAHFRLRPARIGYDTRKAQAYYRELIPRLESLPGVEAAVVAKVPPNAAWGYLVSVSLPGQESVRSGDALRVDTNDVTPGFFDALKMPLVGGRGFSDADRSGAPLVAVVNETLARLLWPDRDPLGLSVVVDGKEHTVIGVAKDIPHRGDEGPIRYLYRSYWQTGEVDSRLLVRVASEPHAMLASLRREIAAVDPDVHIGQEMTLGERTALSFETERLIGNVLTCAGAMAILLSLLGLYGVIAYSVSRRTREIGIRMALGARADDILALVVRQGLRLVVLGIAIGLAAAFVSTRLLASYLYGITPRDPLTFLVVALLLLGTAVVACYVPARRAAKVDPMVALRYE
jgi:predicted permease